jgi:hypothetical protein
MEFRQQVQLCRPDQALRQHLPRHVHELAFGLMVVQPDQQFQLVADLLQSRLQYRRLADAARPGQDNVLAPADLGRQIGDQFVAADQADDLILRRLPAFRFCPPGTLAGLAIALQRTGPARAEPDAGDRPRPGASVQSPG